MSSANFFDASCQCQTVHEGCDLPLLYSVVLLQVQSNSSSGSSTDGALGEVSILSITNLLPSQALSFLLTIIDIDILMCPDIQH